MGIRKNASYLVEVYYTKDEFDSHAKSLKENLHFTRLKNIKTASLYHLSGKITLQQVKEISEKLLIDPLIQNFLIRNRKYGKKLNKHYHYVEIWYKDGITDVTAESIAKVIKDIGIKSNLKIKTGQKYLFYGKIKKEQLEKIVHKLLINELIHQYRVVFN